MDAESILRVWRLLRAIGNEKRDVAGEQIIFAKFDGGEVKHPKTDMDVVPKVPYGTAKEPPKEGDRREVFVDWLDLERQSVLRQIDGEPHLELFFWSGNH